MRPAGKARRPRILGVFEGGATPLDGMQRGPNVTRLRYTGLVRKSGRRCATAAEVRRTAQFLKAVVHRLADPLQRRHPHRRGVIVTVANARWRPFGGFSYRRPDAQARARATVPLRRVLSPSM